MLHAPNIFPSRASLSPAPPHQLLAFPLAGIKAMPWTAVDPLVPLVRALGVLSGAWVPSGLVNPILAVGGALLWAAALAALVAFCALSHKKKQGQGTLSRKVRVRNQ